MYDAVGRQRKATNDETSCGSPGRPRGVRDITLSKNSLFPSNCKTKLMDSTTKTYRKMSFEIFNNPYYK